MEVTKREIMVSVIIFFVLLGLGFLIHYLIIDGYVLEIEKYNKALKIDNNVDQFNYSIETEIGNALVYGDFKVDNGKSFEELKNDYMYIEKVTERYTKHSRQSCSKCGKSTCCHTEYYYTWDRINNDIQFTNQIKFLGTNYDYHLFSNYPEYRLNLEEEIIDNKKGYVNGNYLYKDKKGLFGSSVGDIRYYYNYTPKYFMGTIFVNMKNKTILSYNNSKTIRINNGDIKTTIENKKEEELYTNIIFWAVWIILIGASIFGFVYLENDYLED